MIFQIETTNNIGEIYEVSKIIKETENLNPNILDWYWNKVVPVVLNKSDKIIIAKQKNEII